MKVITLSQGAVDWQARELAHAIISGNNTGYDLMVGVRRGGEYVADAIERHLPVGFCRHRVNVSLQRPSTRGKGARLAAVLGNMPLWMLNSARRLESRWLSMKAPKDPEKATPRKLVIEDGKLPDLSDNPRILLVDDAIDSGITISNVRRELMARYDKPYLKIAVITVTTATPAVEPDYCKYHNRTLIRFPWSIDYKKMKP